MLTEFRCFSLLQVNGVRVGNGVRHRTRSERRATRVAVSFILPSSSVVPVSLILSFFSSLYVSLPRNFSPFTKLNISAKYDPGRGSCSRALRRVRAELPLNFAAPRTLSLIKRDASACSTPVSARRSRINREQGSRVGAVASVYRRSADTRRAFSILFDRRRLIDGDRWMPADREKIEELIGE